MKNEIRAIATCHVSFATNTAADFDKRAGTRVFVGGGTTKYVAVFSLTR